MISKALYHYRLRQKNRKRSHRVRDLKNVDRQVSIIGKSLDLHASTVSNVTVSHIRYAILHQAVMESLIIHVLSIRRFRNLLKTIRGLDNYPGMVEVGGRKSVYVLLSQGKTGRVYIYAFKARVRRSLSRIKQKLLGICGR